MFQRKSHKTSNVAAVIEPSEMRKMQFAQEQQADDLGLRLIGEVAKTYELSSRIREELARKVLLEIRGK